MYHRILIAVLFFFSCKTQNDMALSQVAGVEDDLRLEVVGAMKEWETNPFCTPLHGGNFYLDGPVTFVQGGWKQALLPFETTLRVSWPSGDPLNNKLNWSGPQPSLEPLENMGGRRGNHQRWWHHRYAGGYDVLDLKAIPGYEATSIGVIHGETYSVGGRNGACSLRLLLPNGVLDKAPNCPVVDFSDVDEYYSLMWPTYSGMLSYGFSKQDQADWGMNFNNATNRPAVRPSHPSHMKTTDGQYLRTSQGLRHPDAVLMQVNGSWYVYMYYVDDSRIEPKVKPAIVVARAKLEAGNKMLTFEKYHEGRWVPEDNSQITDQSAYLDGEPTTALSVSEHPNPRMIPVQFQVARLKDKNVLIGIGTYFTEQFRELEVRYSFSRDGVKWSRTLPMPSNAEFVRNRMHQTWHPLTLSNMEWNSSNELDSTFYLSGRVMSQKNPRACSATTNMRAVQLRVR